MTTPGPTPPPEATDARPQSGARLAQVILIAGVVLLAATAVSSAIAIVRLATGVFQPVEGFGALAFVFLWLLLLYPLIFASFRWAAARRYRAAATAYPGAYLLEIVARPSTRTQFGQLARAFGVRAGGLPWNNYALFVADRSALRLWAGGLAPSERIALPTSALVSVAPVVRTIGIRNLTVITIGLQANGVVWPLELLPVRWTGILMRAVPPEMFPAQLAAMQSATHPGA